MKHNLKNSIKLGVIILAIMVLIPMSVNADNETNSIGMYSSKNENSKRSTACENAIFDGDVFTLTESGDNYILTFKVKDGKWNIRVYYGTDIDYTNVFPVTITNDDGTTQTSRIVEANEQNESFLGKTISYTIPKNKYDEQELYAVAELVDPFTIGKNKPTCRVGSVYINNNNKISIDGTGAFFKATLKPISSRNYSTYNENPDVKDHCEAMKNGIYDLKNPDDKTKNIPGDALDAYKNRMRVSFPYCFGEPSSFAYSASDIDRIRKASIDAYREYYELISSDQQEMNREYDEVVIPRVTNINNHYQKIAYGDDKRTVIKQLQCQKDQIDEKTENYYTEVQETDDNNKSCKVTCIEELKVTYDPPVASKAGLCFQYKVTVKSRVTCKVEINPDIPWPTPPSSCSYTPICSGNAHETQAGPSEDFDSCIQECDGGKYSQSCINKCYKKVYGSKKANTKKTSSSTINKTTTKTINNITALQKNSENILKLGNNGNDPYYQIDGCQNNDQIKANVTTCAQKFYELKQRDPRGTFEAITNPTWYTHLWKHDSTVDSTTGTPGKDNWIESIKRSAPYYFRNYAVALKTIQSFYCTNNGRNGFGKARCYIIDDEGVKRQRGSYNCTEVCGFNADGNATNCVTSTSEAVDSIVRAFENISAQLGQCSAKAVCKDGEATFNIGVDESRESQDSKTDWKANNFTSSMELCNNPYGDIQMFIPLSSDKETGPDSICNINPNGINGKCYGKPNKEYWQHYKTTITFPGTWIDLKTGRRYYHREDIQNINVVREKPNYYCVGYDSKPVNEKWWYWRVVTPDKKNVPNPTTPNNIKAKIEDFGKYNWNIEELSCFYAISNCSEKDCPSGSSDETTIDNVRLRPVDQSDLFAGRTDGEIGFNWTSAATDFVAAGTSYGIDPGDYAETLQKEAKNNSDIAYTGTTDYSLHLTKENIKYLRDYANKNGYTSYKGNNKNLSAEKIDGLYYYTSNILENSHYTSKFNRKDGILGVNNEKDK